jgi:hypothetical protein
LSAMLINVGESSLDASDTRGSNKYVLGEDSVCNTDRGDAIATTYTKVGALSILFPEYSLLADPSPRALLSN